jgi:hypothetical protein
MLSPALDDSHEKLVAHGRDFRRSSLVPFPLTLITIFLGAVSLAFHRLLVLHLAGQDPTLPLI